MANNELKLIVSGDGRKLRSTLSNASREISSFAGNSARHITALHNKIGSGLMRVIKNPLAQVASAAGIMALGKQILEFDDKIATVKVQMGLTSKETLALRENIIATANDAKQSWDGTLDSYTEMINRTGDLKFASSAIKTIAVAAKATTSEMLDITAVATGLNMNLAITGDKLEDSFAILLSQGKQGSFVFSELAGQSERLFSAAAVLGLKGTSDLKKYGAFLQMIRPSFGSAEEASTMVKNIMQRIKNEAPEIKKLLKFDVYNADKTLKPFDEIIRGVVSGAGGDSTKLYKIFQEASIAFTQFNNELTAGRGFDKFESFMKTAGSDQLWRDFLEKSATGKSNVQMLVNVFRGFADKALSRAIGNLTQQMNELTSDPQRMADFQDRLDRIAESIGNIADAAVNLGPLFNFVGAGAEMFFGSDRIDKTKQASQLFKQLSKQERNRLRPMISGSDWKRGKYSVLLREHPELFGNGKQGGATPAPVVTNNITINQDADGRIRSVTSDSLSTKNNIAVNRGIHTARQ